MMSLDQTFHHYLQHFPPVVGSIKFGFGEAIYLKQKVQRFQSRYCNGLLGSQIRKARSIIPAFLGPSSQKTWFQTKTQRARCYATLGSQVQSTPFKVLWLRSEPSSVAACLKQDPRRCMVHSSLLVCLPGLSGSIMCCATCWEEAKTCDCFFDVCKWEKQLLIYLQHIKHTKSDPTLQVKLI